MVPASHGRDGIRQGVRLSAGTGPGGGRVTPAPCFLSRRLASHPIPGIMGMVTPTLGVGAMSLFRPLLIILAAQFLLADGASASEGPCVSGLTAGRHPGPYSSLVAFGPQRGQSHCFVCETADRPAVIVFARKPSDALGKLVRGLDRVLAEHKAAGLRAWVTFLAEDQPTLDPLVARWAKEQSDRNVPLSVFENPDGPPSYQLRREAEVTVLLSVKQKVLRNFAFRPGELTEERLVEIFRAVNHLVSK